MTWTYDITNDIGKVRLLISDTNIVPVTNAHFSDEELQYFLTANGDDVNLAAAMALEAWAASFSASVDSERIGDYSYTQSRVTKMLDVAARLRATATDVPAMAWAEINVVKEE